MEVLEMKRNGIYYNIFDDSLWIYKSGSKGYYVYENDNGEGYACGSQYFMIYIGVL